MTKSGAVTGGRATSDWVKAFPEFDRWRPLRLLRRIGPVLQGICLDRTRSDEEYYPTAHVHALTRDFPVISLMLGQRLLGASGQPESIRFSHHASDFQAAADKLSEQSRLSLDEVPALDDIVGEYHSAAAHRQRNGLPPAVPEMEDSILIAAAAGRVDLAAEGLRLAAGLANSWDKSRLPLDWPGAVKWLDGLTLKAEDAEALSALVESQIAQHKLAKIRSV